MIKIIRHQLWNQRRQNGWIFVELVIVSFFLWTVIDPIYVLTSNLALDPGYDEERAYALYMDYYDELHGKFDKAQDSVAIRQENLYPVCAGRGWRCIPYIRHERCQERADHVFARRLCRP